MIIETDKPGTGLLAEVRRTLLVHRASADGLCIGCYEFACVISIFPCSQARWALKAAAPRAQGGRS